MNQIVLENKYMSSNTCTKICNVLIYISDISAQIIVKHTTTFLVCVHWLQTWTGLKP